MSSHHTDWGLEGCLRHRYRPLDKKVLHHGAIKPILFWSIVHFQDHWVENIKFLARNLKCVLVLYLFLNHIAELFGHFNWREKGLFNPKNTVSKIKVCQDFEQNLQWNCSIPKNEGERNQIACTKHLNPIGNPSGLWKKCPSQEAIKTGGDARFLNKCQRLVENYSITQKVNSIKMILAASFSVLGVFIFLLCCFLVSFVCFFFVCLPIQSANGTCHCDQLIWLTPTRDWLHPRCRRTGPRWQQYSPTLPPPNSHVCSVH